jgi:hypothetical protein
MHKIIIAAAALLMLNGCAEPTPDQIARQQRMNGFGQPGRSDPALDRERVAVSTCQYRARLATAGRESRRLIDLEGEAIAGQLVNECVAIYRATGRLP